MAIPTHPLGQRATRQLRGGDKPSVEELLYPPEHVAVVDAAGLYLGTIPALRRQNLRPAQVSLRLSLCFTLSEDRRFWNHHGIDVLACVRALCINVRRRRVSQGGSTITQQLVKNLFMPNVSRWKRKPAEIVAALLLERRASKSLILTSYLNTIYFGGRIFGLAEAAQTYYRKAVAELELSEAAVLASLVRAPNFYLSRAGRPFLLRRARRLMDKVGHARGEATIGGPRLPRLQRRPRAAHRRRTLERQTLLGLASAGLPSERRSISEIQVAADVRLQHRVSAVLGGAGMREAHAAALAVRVSDRCVLAAAAVPYGLDFAVRGRVQPGSSLKPFILVAALESGFRLSDRFTSAESELHFPNGTRWHVRNHEGRNHGEIDLCTALALSDNSVFAQLISRLSLTKVRDVLHRFGILVGKITPAVALGAIREGVQPLQLLNAYATIAAGGIHRPIRVVLRTLDRAGGSHDCQNGAATQATQRDVASAIQVALRLAASTGPAALGITGLAAKTGTADRDHLVCAFREDIAALVWQGKPHGIHEVEKGLSPMKLLRMLASTFFEEQP